MNGGTAQFARVLDERMRAHDFADLQRCWNDPEYRAAVEAEVEATRREVQAKMAAAVARFHAGRGK